MYVCLHASSAYIQPTQAMGIHWPWVPHEHSLPRPWQHWRWPPGWCCCTIQGNVCPWDVGVYIASCGVLISIRGYLSEWEKGRIVELDREHACHISFVVQYLICLNESYLLPVSCLFLGLDTKGPKGRVKLWWFWKPNKRFTGQSQVPDGERCPAIITSIAYPTVFLFFLRLFLVPLVVISFVLLDSFLFSFVAQLLWVLLSSTVAGLLVQAS